MSEHVTVLGDETVRHVFTDPSGLYVDATFGRGGHSRRLLALLNTDARLLVIDRDPEAIQSASLLAHEDRRIVVRQGSFSNLSVWLNELGWNGSIKGIIVDLGVSSPQLDDANRGFSFQVDGPLDMRMDTTSGESAADLLARISEKDLADVLWRYGEERFARRIAHALIDARQKQPLTRTVQVAAIIAEAHPRWDHRRHPATRSFQALRMCVNQELEGIDAFLPQGVSALAVGGRMAVISFHSLEDRAVKQFFRAKVQGAEWSPEMLLGHQTSPAFTFVVRRMEPDAREVEYNPRARSAHLRVIERTAPS